MFFYVNQITKCFNVSEMFFSESQIMSNRWEKNQVISISVILIFFL